MKATLQTAAPVWINNNGMTRCEAHAGFYLRSQIKANPDAVEHDTPIENWVRDTSGEVTCEDCVPILRTAPAAVSVPLSSHRSELEPDARASVIRAIHFYGRARERADFIFGTGLAIDEVERRFERVRRAHEAVLEQVTGLIAPRLSVRVAFGAVEAFSLALADYGSRRYQGEGAEAVTDVVDALDALLALEGDL